ncbi:MAG: RNA polymerase sigma factor [Bacillota bacterium]
MEVTDQKIIRLCKNKKREGFDLLFKKYEKYIFGICYNFTYSKEDALDLMQDVFVKIYKSIDKADETKSVSLWIKKIAVNTCLNFKRDNKDRTTDVSISSTMDESDRTIEDTISDNADTENEVIFMDTKKVLEESIKELPEEVRMAVVLRHIKGLSYEDIANAMNCPLGTVKTYIFRGRRLLKDKLIKKGVWEV